LVKEIEIISPNSIYQQESHSKTVKTFSLEPNKAYRLALTTGEIYW